jgi:hypothetical protein
LQIHTSNLLYRLELQHHLFDQVSRFLRLDRFRNDRLQLKDIEVEDNRVRTTQPRYSKEEFARRGDEIYQSQIRSQVEEGNDGKIVAIDIETAAFEVADNTIDATDRLYDRYPDAQPWVIRIGHRAVYRFGSRSLKKSV